MLNRLYGSLLKSKQWLCFGVVFCAVAAISAQDNLVQKGGFEEGLATPWGTGQYAAKDRLEWWHSGKCISTAIAVKEIHRGGKKSLHIVNLSPRAANIYGTMQQPLSITVGQRYRVSLWAKAKGLTSDGAVSIIVDSAWKIRPIVLNKGSYDWTCFTGDFTPSEATAQLRIISEDVGEAWLDDIQIVPVDVPKELESLGDLVSLHDKPTRNIVGSKGCSLSVEPGVHLTVNKDTFARDTALKVTVADLALKSVDTNINKARIYGISAEHEGALSSPVVLEIFAPSDSVAIAELVGKEWKKHIVTPGATTKIQIDHFSVHWFAVIFRSDFLTPSPAFLAEKERAAANDPAISKEAGTPARKSMRKYIQEGNKSTREFFGVDQHATESHADTLKALKATVARYGKKEGLPPLPSDSPWTNDQLEDVLYATGRPSEKGGFFWDKVKDSQEVIRQHLSESPGRLSPAQFLEICIQANQNDIRLGVLAANNFLKEVTMGGRSYPKFRKALIGPLNESEKANKEEVPAQFGEPASKLQTWRTVDVTPVGEFDKMGPLYHLFSALTAGVWGGTHFSRFAVTGEALVRTTGYSGDHPDPEKGEADMYGASLAKWINSGMPGAENIDVGAVGVSVPANTKATLQGKGTWTAKGLVTGTGSIDLTIDLKKKRVKGTASGSFLDHGVTLKFESQSVSSYIKTKLKDRDWYDMDKVGSYVGDADAGTFSVFIDFLHDRKKDDFWGGYRYTYEVKCTLKDGKLVGKGLRSVEHDYPYQENGEEAQARKKAEANKEPYDIQKFWKSWQDAHRQDNMTFEFPVR